MKLALILALLFVALRWVVAVALLLVITWAGWQLFLHEYCGLPSINLLQLIGFYCCVVVLGLLIGLVAESIRNR